MSDPRATHRTLTRVVDGGVRCARRDSIVRSESIDSDSSGRARVLAHVQRAAHKLGGDCSGICVERDPSRLQPVRASGHGSVLVDPTARVERRLRPRRRAAEASVRAG